MIKLPLFRFMTSYSLAHCFNYCYYLLYNCIESMGQLKKSAVGRRRRPRANAWHYVRKFLCSESSVNEKKVTGTRCPYSLFPLLCVLFSRNPTAFVAIYRMEKELKKKSKRSAHVFLRRPDAVMPIK